MDQENNFWMQVFPLLHWQIITCIIKTIIFTQYEYKDFFLTFHSEYAHTLHKSMDSVLSYKLKMKMKD